MRASLCLWQPTQCLKNTQNIEAVYIWIHSHLGTNQCLEFKSKSTCCPSFVFIGKNYCLDLRLCSLLRGRCQSLLLHWPNAFGLLQLPQGFIPLRELLGQQEHLEQQKSGVSGWSRDETCNDKNDGHPLTILLYSSKSFLTSWDWTSIWSYVGKTQRSQKKRG